MKQEPNNEEQEVMPSYYKSINSSESHPLTSWMSLKKYMTSDPELKAMTETYRKRLANWGYAFEAGRHNEYVCHFGYVCVYYGIDKKDGAEINTDSMM